MDREKILIVEDEAITAMDLKNTLEMLNYNVVSTASRGIEAIEKISELKPDLVLMDIVIKGEMDGIKTAEIVKKQFEIPIIYLTAHSDEKTFERAKLTEPYGFVIKPINHDGLKSTIEIAIYKHALDKKLKESEKKFQLLYEDAPLPYQSLNESGHIIEVNEAWLNALGYSREDVIGKWFGDLLVTPISEFSKVFPKFKDAGEICNIEYEIKRKDGSTMFVEFNGRASIDENGNFQRTHCIFQDITERKKMENILQFQSSILKNIKDAIVVYDLQGKIIYWNEGAEEIYGYSEEEIKGKSVEILYLSRNKANFSNDIDLILENGEYTGKWEGQRKDGSKVDIIIQEGLMHDADGNITGIMGISHKVIE